MLRSLRILLEMIKFEHTLFALPFALMSAMVAARGVPPGWKLFWILVAMVGARSSAMAFNRLADLEYDRRNPRTAGRALPAGLLTAAQAWAFTLATAGVFVVAAGRLNPLALALSPVALGIVWGYSYTKRFTTWTHVFLGLSLGVAPVGAWIGVLGRFDVAPLVLAAAVMLWTAGFDIIYACQDVEVDRAEGLFSLPARRGIGTALAASALLHAAMMGLLVWFGALAGLGAIYWAGLAVVAGAFVYEHSLVKPHDLGRVNAAFFTTNGFVSLALLCFTAADVLIS
jgi:4-hydroxybenzoate polyprenyltransferase